MKVSQSCPTLGDRIDYTVHGILKVRILEWVDFPFSGDLPNPQMEPRSPALQADSLSTEPPENPQAKFPSTPASVAVMCCFSDFHSKNKNKNQTCSFNIPLKK